MDKQKINYQKQLDEVLKEIAQSLAAGGKKPSLLLHACCGPCSSYVLEYLTNYFQITVLYYNPNIYPEAEYRRRFSELKNLYEKFPPALEGKVKVVELPYDPEDFYGAVKTRQEPELAHEPEKGERCRRCYELRLKAAFDYARENHYDYFCTTLSISPFKDAEKINALGAQIEWAARAGVSQSVELENLQGMAAGAEDFSMRQADSRGELESGVGTEKKVPKWLVSDFKKKAGFKRSLELSDEYDRYRQEYCGCIYSYRSREEYEKMKEKQENQLN